MGGCSNFENLGRGSRYEGVTWKVIPIPGSFLSALLPAMSHDELLWCALAAVVGGSWILNKSILLSVVSLSSLVTATRTM